MTLDLARIVSQIGEMVSSVDREREGERFNALRVAWEQLDECELNRRFATAKTSFLLARASHDYRRRFAVENAPFSYVVASTDGSMIVPDRHSPARFYLLNIGKALLRYGERPDACLAAEPDLRFADEDLFVRNSLRRTPVNDVILGLRRASAELRAAADMLEGETAPCLALLDGTLILWSLQSQDPAVVEWVLPEFLEALWTFQQRRQPVAAYISAPGAADLMNSLRVSVCDYPSHGLHVNCDHCRGRIASEGHRPACDVLPGVPDRFLLEQIACLQPGERTSVFDSESKILDQYGDDLRVCYFYLHAGREVARVEIPRWVADDEAQLALTQALIFDQCQRGRGYPVALQEAHEMAVLSMADRRLVEEAIERQLAGIGIVMTRTGKARSKRDRAV